MNIWYIHHYSRLPLYGTPGRPYKLAISLNKLGHKVMVLCATNHHLCQAPALMKLPYTLRNYNGVDYYYLPARAYYGNGMARLLNMLDFARSIGALSQKIDNKELQKPDILIPSCPHPFVFPSAYKLAKKYNAKIIYEVRDIWPLSLIELLDISSIHPFVLWLKWIEKQAYCKSDAIVSLLPNALEHMAPLGLDERKFHYIPNGINTLEQNELPEQLPHNHLKVFQWLKEHGKLIVVYAGAHGPPNALDQVLDLAKLDSNKVRPYHFVFIGDGVEKEKLANRVKDEDISFATFLPNLPKRELVIALSLADICFIGWKKKRIYKFGISPNKIGDYFMSAKPVLHAASAGNDPVKEAMAGITVEPYNAEELDAALKRFCAMTDKERKAMGERGRKYALEYLDWEVLGKQYSDICESVL